MKLGDWLLSKGKITQEQLDRALHDHGFFGGRLGTSLIKLGFVDEDMLGEYLADISNSRYAPARRLENTPSEVIAAVPGRLAARYRIVPIEIKGRTLHLAMRDPKDLIALDEIAFLTGLTIVPYVATEYRIVQAIARYYKITLGTKTIPVAGGSVAEPSQPAKKPSPVRSPPSPARKPGAPELGFDGLPLDASADELDQPFVGASSAPPPPDRLPEGPLPTSLEEWRMAQEEMPEEFPDPPPVVQAGVADPGRKTTPIPRPATGAVETSPARAAGSEPDDQSAERSMDWAAGRLRASDTRDDVFEVLLDFASTRFKRVALFIVQHNRVIGWSGRGAGLSPLRIRNVTVSLDRPSLFVFFRSGGDYFYGPVPDLPANARLYHDLGFPPPARVLLVPLRIKNRASVILYADNGTDAGNAPDIQGYRRLLDKAALALEVLILRNKIMMI